MAGGLGFALGGFADAFQKGNEQNSLANFRTEELKIQQQAQQNTEKRDAFARIDKSRTELMNVISQAIDHGKAAGKDTTEIAQLIQPLVDPLERLTKSSGGDVGALRAQIAVSLAKPGYSDVMGGGGSPAPSGGAAAPAATAPAPSPLGPQPGAPSRNLSDQTITGVQVEDIPPGAPLPTGRAGATAGGPAAAAPQQGDDVERLTRALAITDNPGLRTALTARLQDTLRQRNENVDVKTLKDENGNDHIVFVDKKNRTITGPNGQPYVAPSGGDGDIPRIADAIVSGRQPPVTTGLYRNAKAVKAELERRGFNLTQANMEWQSASTQVKSLNSQRMIQYTSLARSVDRTIDEALSLSKQLDNVGVPLLNKAKLAAYIQTQGNSENGQLAARYQTTINTLREEFANLANGGYAPTESAWALANQQINGDYGVKQLGASLSEVQRLIRYRLQAIPNLSTLGPGGDNRYTGGGGGAQPAPATAPSGGDTSKLSDDELRKRLGIQ